MPTSSSSNDDVKHITNGIDKSDPPRQLHYRRSMRFRTEDRDSRDAGDAGASGLPERSKQKDKRAAYFGNSKYTLALTLWLSKLLPCGTESCIQARPDVDWFPLQPGISLTRIASGFNGGTTTLASYEYVAFTHWQEISECTFVLSGPARDRPEQLVVTCAVEPRCHLLFTLTRNILQT